MRLKPTSFYAIYRDGLVLIEGHAFEVDGRWLVVHKERPQLLVIDKNYKISAEVGFGIPIAPTANRLRAVAFAVDEVSKISAAEWFERCRLVEEARKTLRIVEG